MSISDYMTFHTPKEGGPETRMLTIVFQPKKEFYQALAAEMGRPGEYATDTDVRLYLLDVCSQNMDHVISLHKPKKTTPPKKLRIKRRSV